MIQQLGPFPGEWADVDFSPADGGFVFATHEPPGRIVLRAGLHAMLTRASYDMGRTGLYLRAAADGQGNVCVVLQDGRDRNPATGQYYPAIVVLFPRDGSPREIACPAGPAFGQNAVEVMRSIDGWAVAVVTSPTTYWVGHLLSSGAWGGVQAQMSWAQTSQGFADYPYRMDDVRVRASVPGMVCPSTADGLSIGQAGEPDRIRGLHQGVYFTAIPGPGFEPHLASDGQGRWIACARTPQGAALVALAPPFEAEQPPVEPPSDRWDFVPDGTLVTGAIETLIGTNPSRQGEIICLHKNTFPECEWRKVYAFANGNPRVLSHWADASRFPGDRGWWIEPDPTWCRDTFRSGESVSTENAKLVDFHNGKTNRWRQTNTLYGLKGGGVCVQFDPRFPGQYTDMSKRGTPAWAPAGYEKQWTLKDGSAKWQYIVTPLTAKGVIPWGDPSMDIVIQEAENGPQPPRAPLPFVPCPRPLVATPPPPDPPKEPEMTEAEAVRRASYPVPSHIAQGALNVFRENLLERDKVAPDLMSGGAFRYFFQHYCPVMAEQQVRFGIPGDDQGWGGYSVQAVQRAMDIYNRDQKGVQPPPVTGGTLRGPIGVSGRDFEVPGL